MRCSRHLSVCLFLLANVAVATACRVERTRGIAPLISGATSLGTVAVIAFTGLTWSVRENVHYANVVRRQEARTTRKRGESCSSHQTGGRFVNFTFVGDDGCVLRYFDAHRLFRFEIETSSANALWVHFVGDSDTRGLVMGLLRFLSAPLREAVTKEEFAVAFGCAVTEELRAMGKVACPEPYDLTQLARLGFIDFQFRYEADGAARQVKAYGRTGYSNDTSEMMASVRSDYDLRITYMFAGPDGEFVRSMRYWIDDVRDDALPDVFYLNLGSWFGHKREKYATTTSEVVALIDRLADRLAHRDEVGRIVYGSSLFWRRHTFDAAVAAAVRRERSPSSPWRTKVSIFDRWMFSQVMYRDLNLLWETGHAPFIVNLFDAQRLAQLLSSSTGLGNSELVETSYVPRHFGTNCSVRNDETQFLDTWNAHCDFW